MRSRSVVVAEALGGVAPLRRPLTPGEAPPNPAPAGSAGLGLARAAEQDPVVRLGEKVRTAVLAGRVSFLPWLDPYTEETPAMRRMYSVMLRNAVIKQALHHKICSVASLDLQVTPAGETDRDHEVADFARYCYEDAMEGGLLGMAEELLQPALIFKSAIAEKVWQPELWERGKFTGKRFYRAFKSKEYAEPLYDEFRNFVGVRAQGFGQSEVFPASDFVFLKNWPLFGGPGMSDLRAAYHCLWQLDTLETMHRIHLERYLSPVMTATYGNGFNLAQVEKLQDDLAGVRGRGWLTVPESVKVESLQMALRGEAEYLEKCKDLREQIALSITGAYLQMLTATPQGEIRGNSETHRSTAELLVWELAARFVGALNTQATPQLVQLNYAGADYPKASLGGVNYQELKASIDIDTAAQKMGVPLSLKATARKYSLQVATDPADTLKPAPPGGLGGFGGGGMPFADPGGTPQPRPGAPGGAAGATEGQEFTDGAGNTWRFCGGPGSGKPGPCPTGRKERVKRPLTAPAAASFVNHYHNATQLTKETFAAAVASLDGMGKDELMQTADHVDLTATQGKSLPELRKALAQRLQLLWGSWIRAGITDRHADPESPESFCGGPGSGKPGPCPTGRGKPASKGRKAAAAPASTAPTATHADPMHGHPFAGKSRDEMVSTLTKQSDPQTAPDNPRGYDVTKYPAGVDGPRFVASVTSMVGKAQQANPFQRPTLPAVYEAAKAAQPGLTLAAFQASIVKAAHDKAIELGAFTQATSEIPHPEHAIPLHREKLYYVRVPERRFADPSPTALAGPDGARAEQLLAKAQAHGAAVLGTLAARAVARLLAGGDPKRALSAGRLFTPGERRVLAGALASALAPAELLGRARIARRAHQVAERHADGSAETAQRFSDEPTDLRCFDETGPLAPMAPAEAVSYFRRLVPGLTVDAAALAAATGRQAFSLAVTTDATLLAKVQGIIAGRLESGEDVRGAADEVQALLDQAGVTVSNPAYADMVIRTNLMESYTEGATRELADHTDTFPVWRYLNPADGRSRPEHADRDGRYYDSATAFADVRGREANDVCNCRCSFAAVDAYEWKELQAQGAQVEG